MEAQKYFTTNLFRTITGDKTSHQDKKSTQLDFPQLDYQFLTTSLILIKYVMFILYYTHIYTQIPTKGHGHTNIGISMWGDVVLDR